MNDFTQSTQYLSQKHKSVLKILYWNTKHLFCKNIAKEGPLHDWMLCIENSDQKL